MQRRRKKVRWNGRKDFTVLNQSFEDKYDIDGIEVDLSLRLLSLLSLL
jgi:hypothetical protein